MFTLLCLLCLSGKGKLLKKQLPFLKLGAFWGSCLAKDFVLRGQTSMSEAVTDAWDGCLLDVRPRYIRNRKYDKQHGRSWSQVSSSANWANMDGLHKARPPGPSATSWRTRQHFSKLKADERHWGNGGRGFINHRLDLLLYLKAVELMLLMDRSSTAWFRMSPREHEINGETGQNHNHYINLSLCSRG